MSDVLRWLARAVATVNVALALLMLWGSSGGSGSRRETVAGWLGLLLAAGAVAAMAVAFRSTLPLSPPTLLIMVALPALALVLLRLSPTGETPTRDAFLLLAAFSLPPALLTLAGWTG